MKPTLFAGLLVMFSVLTIVNCAPTTTAKPVPFPMSSTTEGSTTETKESSDNGQFWSRVGRAVAVSLGIGLGGIGGVYGPDPYPFGYPYPCTVYGYPAPYAPPGSHPCGYPYYFG